MTLGEPAEAGTCTVTLTGFTETGATFEGDCGGGGQAAAPAEGSGEGTAVAVGAAATLADGKLRVFLSRIDAEAGTAQRRGERPAGHRADGGAAGRGRRLHRDPDRRSATGEATIDATC